MSTLDERTRNALEEGRRTAGAMLRAAQANLQKVFLVFLLAFLGAFYALRLFLWRFLKSVTVAQMDASTAQRLEFIAQTPFDVILLQAKISLLFGVLVALPLFLYYARDALKVRGLWPRLPLSRWKMSLLAVVAVALFALGLVYGYFLFFPMLFRFLVGSALSAGFEPTYSIVLWAEFVFLLTVTFGFAAQLPLVIGGLVYAEIVSYETFRDEWRYAVLAIVVVSSMVNGSPDPLSMSLVAVPLIALYAVGVGLARVIVATKRDRGGDEARGPFGDPAGLDLETLDAAGVRAAPDEVFADLTEDEAVSLAGDALDAGDHEKARAVFERYDAVHDSPPLPVGNETTGVGADEPDADEAPTEWSLLEELTEGGRNEDDVGRYYEDVAFVVDSVASRSFRVVGVFMAVLALSFTWLYSGGIGTLRRDFLARLPADVPAGRMEIVTLHPVEALIFEMKFSTLVAVLATLPVVAYYAWPALREREFVSGRRAVFGGTAALILGLVGGIAFGYSVVAPAVISYLVADAVRANMVISYRITDFFWLVVFTTGGIGLLADVPVPMLLLNAAGVPYRTMRSRWREVTVAIMVFAAVFTPPISSRWCW